MVSSVDYKEPKAEVKFDFVYLEMIHLPLTLIHFLLAGWLACFSGPHLSGAQESFLALCLEMTPDKFRETYEMQGIERAGLCARKRSTCCTIALRISNLRDNWVVILASLKIWPSSNHL